MRNYEAEFEQMDPADIVVRVRELEAALQPAQTQSRSSEDVEDMFELLAGLAALGKHEQAATVFGQLRLAIMDYESQQEDAEKALRYLIDWSLLALRFTPEKRNEFVCMPIYTDLFAAIEAGPETQRYQAVRAQLQLIRHYEFWQGKGGTPEALPEAHREMLETAVSSFPENAEAAIEAHQAREDWEGVVRLCRYASSYYLSARKPNDAIRTLKLGAQHMPSTEGYHVADGADMYMQLGTVFLEYKKYDVAIKYFRQAKEMYESGGEELEMFGFQAEGWIEEAEKRKGG